MQAALAVSGLPSRLLHCRSQPFSEEPADDAAVKPARFVLDDAEFLRRALILGRCNEHFHDPSKPVLWTRKRLARRVRLYQTGDFYHGDQ